MQSLQQKASDWSGVAAADAFAIDETNLFETLGGLQPFIDLSTNFYNRSSFWSFLPHYDSFHSLSRICSGFDFGFDLGFSMTRRSGFGRSLLTRRRRTRFRTSTSSWCRGWEVLLSIPRGKVDSWLFCFSFFFFFPYLLPSSIWVTVDWWFFRSSLEVHCGVLLCWLSGSRTVSIYFRNQIQQIKIFFIPPSWRFIEVCFHWIVWQTVATRIFQYCDQGWEGCSFDPFFYDGYEIKYPFFHSFTYDTDMPGCELKHQPSARAGSVIGRRKLN